MTHLQGEFSCFTVILCRVGKQNNFNNVDYGAIEFPLAMIRGRLISNTKAIVHRGYNHLRSKTKSLHSKTDPYIPPSCFGDYKVKFCQNSTAKRLSIKRQLGCTARLSNP